MSEPASPLQSAEFQLSDVQECPYLCCGEVGANPYPAPGVLYWPLSGASFCESAILSNGRAKPHG